MTKKADDTHEAVSFIETDGGSRMTTMGATHPWEPTELSRDDSTIKADRRISPMNQ